MEQLPPTVGLEGVGEMFDPGVIAVAGTGDGHHVEARGILQQAVSLEEMERRASQSLLLGGVDPITNEPSLTSPQRKGFVFLRLPPELWSSICEMIVLEAKPIKCFSKLGWRMNQSTVIQPGISRTCRLLRHHTLRMFYEQNTFMVYNQIAMPNELVCWLNAIGFINRSRLRRLYLWTSSSETITRIEEHFADAGTNFPTWTDYKDSKTGFLIRQLAFAEDVEHDEERLQRDLDLLRTPRSDNG